MHFRRMREILITFFLHEILSRFSKFKNLGSNQEIIENRESLKIKISSIFTDKWCRSVDYFIRNSRKILEKFLTQYPEFAEVKRRPKSDHRIFFNFLQKIDIFRRSFMIFCTNLDKSFHIVSKNIMVHKG